MKLTIAILNWNTKDLLKNCLFSVYETVKTPCEIIVVDNASTDGSKEYLEARGQPAQPAGRHGGRLGESRELKLILNSKNEGFAKGNNQAFEASSGDYFLVLNSDTVLLPGAIDNMVEFLDKNPTYAAATSALLNEDGSVQFFMHRRFPTFFRLVPALIYYHTGRGGNLSVLKKYVYLDKDLKVDFDLEQPAGTCILVRRQTVNEIGGLFDEKNFPLFFNDVDFAWRMKKAAKKIRYLSQAKIIHFKGASTSKLNFFETGEELGVGSLKFFRKNNKLNYLLLKASYVCLFSLLLITGSIAFLAKKIDKQQLNRRGRTLKAIITEKYSKI